MTPFYPEHRQNLVRRTAVGENNVEELQSDGREMPTSHTSSPDIRRALRRYPAYNHVHFRQALMIKLDAGASRSRLQVVPFVFKT